MYEPETGMTPMSWQYAWASKTGGAVLLFLTVVVPFTIADYDLLDDFECQMLMMVPARCPIGCSTVHQDPGTILFEIGGQVFQGEESTSKGLAECYKA